MQKGKNECGMNEKQKKAVLWISVVVWMGIIFMFSAQNSTESSSLSGSVVGAILHAIKTVFPDIRQIELNHLQLWISFFIRKAAHASIYFILGILVYTAIGKKVSRKKRFLMAVAVCFLYACTDEFHQRFVPGRSCEFRDVCIDTGGALLGISFVIFINWIRRIKNGRPWKEAIRDIRIHGILWGIAGVIFVIVLCCLYLYLGKNILVTTKYTMKSADIPEAFDGYKILQISDFHSKKFPDNNEGLAKTINELEPDIIVATGDMLNAAQDDDGEVFLELIPKLDPDIPIYYTAGNHESVDEITDPKSASVYFERTAELGVIRLDNGKVVLNKEGESIDLYGLEIEMTYYRDRRNPDFDKLKLKSEHIEELIGPAEDSRFVVLMAHNPLYFEAYAKWGADLTLTGHVHGGMIYVPLKGGMFSPEYSLWPQYYAGDYHMDDKVMFVNRGIGSSGTIPVRILDNPEVCLITLEKLQ